MRFIKVMRKQCLRTGCKATATHFGIRGHRNWGLCDEHYAEFHDIVDELERFSEQLKSMIKEDAQNANPAN